MPNSQNVISTSGKNISLIEVNTSNFSFIGRINGPLFFKRFGFYTFKRVALYI